MPLPDFLSNYLAQLRETEDEARIRRVMEDPRVGDQTKYWLQGGRWNNLDSDWGLSSMPFLNRMYMTFPQEQQSLLLELGMPGFYSKMPLWEPDWGKIPTKEWGPDLVGKPKRKT